jgi:hypothetical protein
VKGKRHDVLDGQVKMLLCRAAEMGHREVVRLFIENGAKMP